ncbi:hypothetical protein D1B31_13550 [Neobacillus notoginsengisoli]|uniref:Uncharacterized protein n=1 Tax=Neobacillus notoginsengisoli TaxID=1578198 RepID=A0A417YSM4_9BACI|nr:hypothetical protein D1B31_13550 [Neobacillus notoginsengisoli]
MAKVVHALEPATVKKSLHAKLVATFAAPTKIAAGPQSIKNPFISRILARHKNSLPGIPWQAVFRSSKFREFSIRIRRSFDKISSEWNH